MLIATDLDGTLVPTNDAEPSRYTAEVLRRTEEAGVPVVFVTGRPLRWMAGFWPHVAAHGMAVVSNGAVVWDLHAGEPIAVAGLAPADGLDLVAEMTAAVPGITFAIECLDGIRLDHGFGALHPVPPGSLRGSLAQLWDTPALKLLTRHTSMGDEEFREGVLAAVGDRATATWSVAGLVEISAPGVSKASALTMVCQRLKVPREEVVAFGDMPNDIPMLAWAGTSYAMRDGHESVLAVADHIAPPCAHDGVAHVLTSILDTHRRC